jgi:hypothetical protein
MYRRLANFNPRLNPLKAGLISGGGLGIAAALPAASIGGLGAGIRNAVDKTATQEEKAERMRRGLLGGAATGAGLGLAVGGYGGVKGARFINNKLDEIDNRIIDQLLD